MCVQSTTEYHQHQIPLVEMILSYHSKILKIENKKKKKKKEMCRIPLGKNTLKWAENDLNCRNLSQKISNDKKKKKKKKKNLHS